MSKCKERMVGDYNFSNLTGTFLDVKEKIPYTVIRVHKHKVMDSYWMDVEYHKDPLLSSRRIGINIDNHLVDLEIVQHSEDMLQSG